MQGVVPKVILTNLTAAADSRWCIRDLTMSLQLKALGSVTKSSSFEYVAYSILAMLWLHFLFGAGTALLFRATQDKTAWA